MLIILAALAVLGLLIYYARKDLERQRNNMGLVLEPEPRRRRRGRRQTTTRRRNPRPQPTPPPASNLDRAGLVTALIALGHRVSDANRLAASVPADIDTIEDAITSIYRRA